jgi:4-amino-4-deoxy-L-arabinose transferase-like glycosyltransferase
MDTRRLSTVEAALALAAVIGLALFLRLTFVTGIVHSDAVGYAQAAHDLATKGLHLGADGVGRGRLGTYAPLALIYAVFGVSQATTLAWPLLCSLATAGLIYAIGCLLAGESAGLIAALVWAIMPLDISLATSLLPDGPLTTFSTAAVLLLLLAERSKGWRALPYYVSCALCLAAASMVKQTGMILILFVVARFISKRRSSWLSVVAGLGALGLVAALFWYHFRFTPQWLAGAGGGAGFSLDTLVATSTDWYRAVTQAREFFVLLPLFVVAIAASLSRRLEGAAFAALWLATTFLYMELGTRSPFVYLPWSPEIWQVRILDFTMVPCAVLVGIYLGGANRPGVTRIVVAAAAIVVAGMALHGARDMPTLPAWLLGQADSARPFARLSALAGAVAIFGAIASPAIAAARSSVVKAGGVAVLVVAVGLGTLNASYEATTDYHMPWVQNVRQAVRFLGFQPDRQWLAQNWLLGAHLDYQSGFSRGFDAADPSLKIFRRDAGLQVAPPDVSEVGSAYVITDEFFERKDVGMGGPAYLRARPPTWREIATFGTLDGYRMHIYRVPAADGR